MKVLHFCHLFLLAYTHCVLVYTCWEDMQSMPDGMRSQEVEALKARPLVVELNLLRDVDDTRLSGIAPDMLSHVRQK